MEMYGESQFMHFWVDILIVLYIFGFGTAQLGEWRLNHIYGINGAKVISASCLVSSAELDYSYGTYPACTVTCFMTVDHKEATMNWYRRATCLLYICV